MKKIDKRVAKYVVLDTETTNSIECPLAYDIGFAVIDSKGRVYEKFSFTIADIYCEEKELMKSAYYVDKLPQYEEEMAKGERKMVSLATAKKILAEICREYNVKQLWHIMQDLIIEAPQQPSEISLNPQIAIFSPMA